MLAPVHEVASLAIAQAAPGCGGDGGLGFMPIVIMMLIFYFLVISPARKERKNHATMLESLKRNDEVITNSGMLGTIADIDEQLITLEISKNVKVRVLRSSILKKYVEPKTKEKEESKAS